MPAGRARQPTAAKSRARAWKLSFGPAGRPAAAQRAHRGSTACPSGGLRGHVGLALRGGRQVAGGLSGEDRPPPLRRPWLRTNHCNTSFQAKACLGPRTQNEAHARRQPTQGTDAMHPPHLLTQGQAVR